MSSPFLYFASDRLSIAELSAARLDGHLVEVDGAYAPADTVETPALRAGAMRLLLGDTLAATHLSAAWIHGALAEPPARHTVQRAVTRRIHGVIHRRLHYRDVCLPASDLQRIGGVLVTDPVRTVLDLARTPDGTHDGALAAMIARDGRVVETALARLTASGPLPHKLRAIETLAAMTT